MKPKAFKQVEPMKYWTLHRWVRREKTKPEFCENCKIDKPRDIANISGNYQQDLNDFEWLCRKCHMQKDGRAMRFASMASHKGTNHSLSRLNERQILCIRDARKNGITYSKIAKLYGISISHAHRICFGVAWKHLNGKVKP